MRHMKKKHYKEKHTVKVLLTILLFLVLLTSCRVENKNPIPEEKELNDIPTLTTEVEDEEQEIAIPTEPLEFLSKERYSGISNNNNTAYFLRSIFREHLWQYQPGFTEYGKQYFVKGYLMAYVTDFTTATTKPLCSLEDCSHTSPECEAWIESNHINASLLAGKNHLFYISSQNTESFSYIDILEPDGSDRRRIYTAEKDHTIENNFLFCDETYVTFLLTIGYKNSRTPLQELITVDIHTFEIVSKHKLQFPDEHYWTLKAVGIYDNKPLFDHTSYTLNGREEYMLISGEDTTVFTFDVFSGIITELMSKKSNIDSNFWFSGTMFTGTSFIEFDYTNRVIVEVYLDGSEKILSIQLEPSDRNPYPVFLRGTKLLLDYGYPSDPYCVDISTGELTDFTLMRRGYIEEELPIEIVAESETEFLVISGLSDEFISNSPIEYYDNTSGYGGRRNIYAMILKEDYFNSIPNYRIITFN